MPGGAPQGPERFAEPFHNFGDDVVEHCNLAAKLAMTGRAASAAREQLGATGSVKPVHIVLPKRADSNVNISDFGSRSDKNEGRRFCAWAFFFHPNNEDEDAEGAMVHFFMSKYTKRNQQRVDEEWKVEPDLVFRVDSHRISNKNIKAAIERDAGTFNLDGAAIGAEVAAGGAAVVAVVGGAAAASTNDSEGEADAADEPEDAEEEEDDAEEED